MRRLLRPDRITVRLTAATLAALEARAAADGEPISAVLRRRLRAAGPAWRPGPAAAAGGPRDRVYPLRLDAEEWRRLDALGAWTGLRRSAILRALAGEAAAAAPGAA